MARLLIGAALGVMVGMVAGAALGIRAQSDPTDDTIAAAAEAGLDPILVQGALNSQPWLDARTYLIGIGALAPPASAVVRAGDGRPSAVLGSDWPIGGALGQRIYCIEAIESRHGAAMYNPTPIWNGEHAQGWLGFIPSTARRWGVVIGDRASEWSGAAAMLRAGAGGQFAGVAWGRC